MAIWDRNKVLPSALNSGNEYVEGDFPTEETLNAANNNAFYSVDFTEALADAPDNTEAGNIGTPTVTLIDNVKTIDGTPKTFKKFKFANLKGEKGDAGINDALVVQTFGTSTDDAISQKVITDKFADVATQINDLDDEVDAHKAEYATDVIWGHIKLPENWIAPALLNGWINFGGGEATAAYYKDNFGVVHLKGLVKSGTSIIFILPMGYRPTSSIRFPVSNSLGYAQVDVDVNGNVIKAVGTNTDIDLSPISFRVL